MKNGFKNEKIDKKITFSKKQKKGNFKLRICDILIYPDHLDSENIRKIVDSKSAIQHYAFILHDKDVYLEEDDNIPKNHHIGDLKKPHYHVYLRMKNSYRPRDIASWFNLKQDYFVEKIKGRFADALNYATHRKDPKKFQYDDTEVISNFDWISERNSVSDTLSERQLESLLTQIDDGFIRRYNLVDFISRRNYSKFKNKINDAFDYRLKVLLKNVERTMDCIFIQGESGTGKTTFAKKIAYDRNLTPYISSSENDPLGNYDGQGCIILDDLRPHNMALSDLLKMLDNNTASTVRSRYYNKYLECELIIITTTLDIETFFNNTFHQKEEKETAIQLRRRCKVLLKMDKKEIKQFIFNPIKDEYELRELWKNEIFDRFHPEGKFNKKEQDEISNSIMGKTSEGMKKLHKIEDKKRPEPKKKVKVK